MIVRKFFEKFNYWTTSVFSQIAIFDHEILGISLSNKRWAHLKPGEFTKENDAYLTIPAQFYIRLDSGWVYLINIYEDDFAEFLNDLSPEELREVLYELFLETEFFKGLKSGELELLNRKTLANMKAETLEILKQYGISNEFLEKLESYTVLVPLHLKPVNHTISYVLAGIYNKSIDTYVGIQNSGIFGRRKAQNTMDYFTELLKLNSLPSSSVTSASPKYSEISLAAVLLAATFNAPVGLTLQNHYATTHTQLQVAYDLVFPENQLKVFLACQTLFNFPKAIDDLLPDSLIEKLEKGEPLTADEEYAVAKFLDIASVLARIGQNRPRLKRYTDKYSVGFVYELAQPTVLDGTFNQLPAKLQEEILKTEQMSPRRYTKFTFSNKLGLLVKVYNSKVYVFYKKDQIINWVILSDPSKLRKCKEVIKERHYAY